MPVVWKLRRPEAGSGWMVSGPTVQDVLDMLRDELEACSGLTPEECGTMVLEAVDMTEEEIEGLPEFPGW